MRLPILLLFLSGLAVTSVSAQHDFMVLKKRNRTVKNYMTGSYIECRLDNDQWINGYIKTIRNDSVFITPIEVKQAGTIWGSYMLDTSWYATYPVAIKNITAFPKQGKSADIFTNGVLLQMGSGAYMLLNIINGLSNKEEVFTGSNLTNLGIAAGVFGVGTLLHATRESEWAIGKKYRLEYIKMD